MKSDWNNHRTTAANRLRQSLATLATCACLAAATFDVGAQTVSGIGTRRCEAFNRALEMNSEAAIDAYLAWAQGYLSGVNTNARLARDIQIDHGGLLHWLANHCKGAPRDLYVEAVQGIVEEWR